jgi:hypothetical protein
MFSIFTIIRIIFNGIFAFSSLQASRAVTHIEKQTDCPCSKGWKISTAKPLSSLFFVISIINIFVSANNILSQIPLIGSSYALIFLLCLFMELFTMSRLAKCLQDEENSDCDIKGHEPLFKFFQQRSITECAYISIVLTIIFFYL